MNVNVQLCSFWFCALRSEGRQMSRDGFNVKSTPFFQGNVDMTVFDKPCV